MDNNLYVTVDKQRKTNTGVSGAASLSQIELYSTLEEAIRRGILTLPLPRIDTGSALGIPGGINITFDAPFDNPPSVSFSYNVTTNNEGPAIDSAVVYNTTTTGATLAMIKPDGSVSTNIANLYWTATEIL